MVQKTAQKKQGELETISFRGKRNLWLKFIYITKKRNEKNTWAVLSRLIKSYISKEKQGVI